MRHVNTWFYLGLLVFGVTLSWSVGRGLLRSSAAPDYAVLDRFFYVTDGGVDVKVYGAAPGDARARWRTGSMAAAPPWWDWLFRIAGLLGALTTITTGIAKVVLWLRAWRARRALA
jgi:hypothetical protein